MITWDIALIERKDFEPLMVELTKPVQRGLSHGEKERDEEGNKVCVGWALLPPQPDHRAADRSVPEKRQDVRDRLEQLVELLEELLRDDDSS